MGRGPHLLGGFEQELDAARQSIQWGDVMGYELHIVLPAGAGLAPSWDYYLVRKVLEHSPDLWDRVVEDAAQAFIGLQDAGMVGELGRRLQLRRFERRKGPGHEGPTYMYVDYLEEARRAP